MSLGSACSTPEHDLNDLFHGALPARLATTEFAGLTLVASENCIGVQVRSRMPQ
jgi:hypothetical protein